MQAVKSLELRIPERFIDEESFAELAEALHTQGSAHEREAATGDGTHIAWFDAGADEQQARARLAAAALIAGVPAEGIFISTVESGDWATAWQSHWQGMPIGRRLWVRPSFREPAPEGKLDIVLDPGMAFGTGTHPTTRLCLEAVERICDNSPPADLLDMGAGSGILAIAALKLGAGKALAIDMEEESVEACRINAAINGVPLAARLGNRPPAGRFDLVVANILAGPLIDMAPALAACVGHHLILSGLLDRQVDGVAAAYLAEGLRELRRDQQEEWASVEFGRP